MRYILLFCVLSVAFTSCRPPVYTPKPTGYYRLELPAHSYQKFDVPGFPYSFEYPTYGHAFRDTLTPDGRKFENRYWMNIDFPEYNGRIYLSYKAIDGASSVEKLLGDSHEMSYYHTKKADYINPNTSVNENGVMVLTYSVGGNAASAYQFIATDSSKHFLRGSLYFNVTPNADSLRPVNEFFRKDLERLISTLKWKDQ
jgi:gliding motility-associated lipoprotein GldD